MYVYISTVPILLEGTVSFVTSLLLGMEIHTLHSSIKALRIGLSEALGKCSFAIAKCARNKGTVKGLCGADGALGSRERW